MTKTSALRLQKVMCILQNDNERNNDKSERVIITGSGDGVTVTRELQSAYSSIISRGDPQSDARYREPESIRNRWAGPNSRRVI